MPQNKTCFYLTGILAAARKRREAKLKGNVVTNNTDE